MHDGAFDMKWSKEAEKTMKRVPFFIRKMVRKRVEDYANQHGVKLILNEHIEACRQSFMNNMERELKGFSVEACLGANGCPNRTLGETNIVEKIEYFLEKQGLKEFLSKKLSHPMKVHNEFRVSVSFCPNSCSRPQIVDVGLIGAVAPVVNLRKCQGCNACIEVCQEDACLPDHGMIAFREEQCLYCGSCAQVCPTSAIQRGKEGFRILVGGKLGRRPQLGFELPGIFSTDSAVEVVKKVVSFYKKRCAKGERLGAILAKTGLESLLDELNLPQPGRNK